MSHTSDVAKMDRLSKAKMMGILELSPEDEVEGELLYFQARLLDNAVAVKHRFGHALFFLSFYRSFSHRIMYHVSSSVDGTEVKKKKKLH